MYSIGNEILELASPIGSSWSRRLAEGVRALDDTRFVTNGINGIIANIDAHGRRDGGWPRAEPGIGPEHDDGEHGRADGADERVRRSSPSRPRSRRRCSTSSGSTTPTRGTRWTSTAFPHRVIVGSETFPERIDIMWGLVERLPHVIGDFTWTGWDYLGEAGIGRVDYTDAEGYEATGTVRARTPICSRSRVTSTSPGTGVRSRTTARSSTACAPTLTSRCTARSTTGAPRRGRRGRGTTPWRAGRGRSAPGSPVIVDVYSDARRGRAAARRRARSRTARVGRGEGVPRSLRDRVPPGRADRGVAPRRRGDGAPRAALGHRRAATRRRGPSARHWPSRRTTRPSSRSRSRMPPARPSSTPTAPSR